MQVVSTISDGSLLVAEPFLADDTFARTVVCITQHNSEGTVGYVLNRPLLLNVADVVPQLSMVQTPIYWGGPVQEDTLHSLHYTEAGDIEGSVAVYGGLRWGGNIESIVEYLHTFPEHLQNFRFYLGYSGWSPGQLEHELQEKAWVCATAEEEFLHELVCFPHTPKNVWSRTMNALGGEYAKMRWVPRFPSMN